MGLTGLRVRVDEIMMLILSAVVSFHLLPGRFLSLACSRYYDRNLMRSEVVLWHSRRLPPKISEIEVSWGEGIFTKDDE